MCSLASFSLDLPPGLPSVLAITLAGAGAFFLTTRVLSLVRVLLSLFVLPGKPLKSFGNPSSTWALVTGASDGIGAEFARQLAAAGFGVVLVSRTPAKLAAVAEEIRAAHPGARTRTVALEFSRRDMRVAFEEGEGEMDDGEYAELKTVVRELDISILINNVGLSHTMPVPFAQTSSAELESIIAVNCAATLRVTRLVLPGMLARRRGLVLNMGSFAGLVPSPLLATYSGSKAFLQHWSAALAAEAAPAGVTVELVQSYLVMSAMSKIRRPSALVPPPRPFVRAVLAKVGCGGGSSYAYSSAPYWAHGLIVWGLDTTVGVMSRAIVSYTKTMHEDIRRRALRKAAREAKKE